jgi:integrative and conjugative element protein (TIGR02256 family)
MLEYPIGSSGQVVVLSEEVVGKFRRYRQKHWYQREAGGQLFAQLSQSRIVVEEATGPRRTDRRTRTSYVPDRAAEQREINTRHAEGLHYVGDWHTHPETYPGPSGVDIASISESVRKSMHALNGFLLVIVGQSEPPDGLLVTVHDRFGSYSTLTPAAASRPTDGERGSR